MGLFDRICSAESMMKFPALYKASQNAELFNAKVQYWKMFTLGKLKLTIDSQKARNRVKFHNHYNI